MNMYELEPMMDPGLVDPLADRGLEPAPARSPVDVLRELLEGSLEYLDVEQDEEDKEKGARILALVQQLLAINQKQSDQLMGANPAAKALRKATGL